jgi:hypothetical protein
MAMYHEPEYPVLTSLDFAAVILYKDRSLAMHPIPNLKYQVPVFMNRSDSVSELHPKTPDSLSSPSKLTGQWWSYSNLLPHEHLNKRGARIVQSL